jgi:tetratricopeptide (TPR) repeat protein
MSKARVALGMIKTHTNRAAQGIREFDQALALDRNIASAHAFIGVAKFFEGREEETEAHVQEALRLSPCDTDAHVWMTIAGYGKLRPGAYEEAAARFRRAIDINRNSHFPHFFLAACLAQFGRLEEARAAARAGLALAPAFTVAQSRASLKVRMSPKGQPERAPLDMDIEALAALQAGIAARRHRADPRDRLRRAGHREGLARARGGRLRHAPAARTQRKALFGNHGRSPVRA